MVISQSFTILGNLVCYLWGRWVAVVLFVDNHCSICQVTRSENCSLRRSESIWKRSPNIKFVFTLNNIARRQGDILLGLLEFSAYDVSLNLSLLRFVNNQLDVLRSSGMLTPLHLFGLKRVFRYTPREFPNRLEIWSAINNSPISTFLFNVKFIMRRQTNRSLMYWSVWAIRGKFNR